MPMHIEIPPTLASLCVAIDSKEVPPGVEDAIKRGREAIAAYDQLTPELRAAYVHAIRSDIATLNTSFQGVLNDALRAYPGNAHPEKSLELAHLAVQAGEAELGHRFLHDAHQLGAAEDAKPAVQALVAATPTVAVPLHEELAAKDATPTPADLNLIGLQRLERQDTQGAKAAFESALDLDPDNPEHLNNLALTQIHSGLIRQGTEGAIRALEMKPELPLANLVLATACLEHAVAWASNSQQI